MIKSHSQVFLWQALGTSFNYCGKIEDHTNLRICEHLNISVHIGKRVRNNSNKSVIKK